MTNTFIPVSRDALDGELARVLEPIRLSWTGVSGKGVALTNTAVSDAARYALDAANAGTDKKALRAVADSHSLTVNGSGITLSSAAITGDVTIGGTLEVDGNVTLGDNASDTLTVNAVSTFVATVNVTDDAVIGGDISAARGVFGTTTFSGSEELRVSGQTRLEGAVTVTASGMDVTGSSVFQDGLSITAGGISITAGGLSVLTGTTDLQYGGTSRIKADSVGVGFFAATPVARPTVTGTRTGTLAQLQTVVANLLSALGATSLGLITDSTT